MTHEEQDQSHQWTQEPDFVRMMRSHRESSAIVVDALTQSKQTGQRIHFSEQELEMIKKGLGLGNFLLARLAQLPNGTPGANDADGIPSVTEEVPQSVRT